MLHKQLIAAMSRNISQLMALHFELGTKSLITISVAWLKKVPEKHFKLSKMSLKKKRRC